MTLKKEIQKIQAFDNPFAKIVVHAHGPRAGLFSALAVPRGITMLFTEHNYTKFYRLQGWFNNLIQTQMMNLVYRRSNYIIAVSSAVKNYLLDKKVPAGKAVVIFNAFESKSDKKTKKISDDPVIGTIGNLNSQKGQKYLIRALPSVLKKYPTAKIEIIGEGKERNSLVTETKRLNLQGKVTLLGKKTDLQKYLSDWTVFVLPSISETFGIVILEAMDAGIPVVATKSGGTTDIVKSGVNGLLVERKNPESLAKKIIKILDKPELAGDLTRNALKDLPRFSWTTIIGKLEDLYQSI